MQLAFASPACHLPGALALDFGKPRCLVPLAGAVARAGFPSPADDYIEHRLDLNEWLIRHPAATFFWKVRGQSMRGAGIFDGDILVVDRALTPESDDIVLLTVDGAAIVKIFMKRGDLVWLEEAAPERRRLPMRDGVEVLVWGVVTGTVRRFR